MMFEDYFLTKELNDYWTDAIINAFPILAESTNTHFLSLQEYISSVPQKFYNKDLFKDYYQFWDNLINNNPSFIKEYFNNQYHKLDIAFDVISKINHLSFHDTKIPTEEPLAIKFINDNINYNYLKLVESVLYVLILPIAIQTRIARNAQTDKLDVWNCIEEIRNTSFSYIIDCYNNTIRNGVAHGTVAYSAYNITYFDKKGNIYTDNVNQVVGLFDMLLDNCNAMMAALKCIMIKHSTFFYEHEIKIPSSYLIQELKAICNTPQWEVQDCLSSQILGGKNQLNIYVDNKHYHYDSVAWLALRTAALAEAFTPGYSRYFIHMNVKYGKYSAGWAGYDGTILQKGRQSNNIKDLRGVTDAVYFYPKYKIPRLINSIHATYLSIKNKPIANRLYNQPIYIIRDTKIYRKEHGYCINDARIYLTNIDNVTVTIDRYYKEIVNDVIKYSKKRLGKFHIKSMLPVIYIRVMVYNTDMRLRAYDSNGLKPTLICTIGFNVSKHIKNIDIYGGTTKLLGKYRIVWNHKWLIENNININSN